MNKLGRPPRVLRLLAQHGAAALAPKIENGRYRYPMVSSRLAAVVRKRAILEGTFGNFSTLYGGWDPAWDKPAKMYLLKPKRGHLRERTRDARAAKITAAMKAMPDRIQKYEQEIKDKKPKKDVSTIFSNAKHRAISKK